jgi:hypothetical protein
LDFADGATTSFGINLIAIRRRSIFAQYLSFKLQRRLGIKEPSERRLGISQKDADATPGRVLQKRVCQTGSSWFQNRSGADSYRGIDEMAAQVRPPEFLWAICAVNLAGEENWDHAGDTRGRGAQ